ncbi:hypothetical protein HQN83_03905 [Pedobacter sp. LMG 31643]|nr:hypothetical protein [Pedobacter foliorum]
MLLLLTSTKISAQNFKFLIPDEAIVQYAGSIGYFSGGVGYELFGNKRGNLDLLYGFVPGSKGGVLNIATAKFGYRPWSIKVKDWGKFYPFNPAIFATYTFHKDLSFKFPSGQYAHDYYYWSEALRPHLAFSSEIELDAKKLLKNIGIRAIGLYIEANTNDFYLINYFQNTSALTVTDIFQLGIGMRVKF